MTGNVAREGTVRQGRCIAMSSSAEMPRRSAVAPGAPTIGISCFATAAPTWNESIATTRLTTAAIMRSSRQGAGGQQQRASRAIARVRRRQDRGGHRPGRRLRRAAGATARPWGESNIRPAAEASVATTADGGSNCTKARRPRRYIGQKTSLRDRRAFVSVVLDGVSGALPRRPSACHRLAHLPQRCEGVAEVRTPPGDHGGASAHAW